MRTKLTRQYLLSLADGAYLVSNVATPLRPVHGPDDIRPNDPPTPPCWRAHLDGKVDREVLWQDAKLCRANGRLVDVVWTESEFNKLLTEYRRFA